MPPHDFKTNFSFQQQYEREVKRALGEVLFTIPPIEEDLKHNTDLWVMKCGETRVSCRIRRFDKNYSMYRHEFTFRCSSPGGYTELQKIRDGWGDYFFYGFGGDNGQLVAWTIADLEQFRLQEIVIGPVPGLRIPNRDGSSEFMVYRWDAMIPEFIVAQSLPETQAIVA